jgi:hypothetical protein
LLYSVILAAGPDPAGTRRLPAVPRLRPSSAWHRQGSGVRLAESQHVRFPPARLGVRVENPCPTSGMLPYLRTGATPFRMSERSTWNGSGHLPDRGGRPGAGRPRRVRAGVVSLSTPGELDHPPVAPWPRWPWPRSPPVPTPGLVARGGLPTVPGLLRRRLVMVCCTLSAGRTCDTFGCWFRRLLPSGGFVPLAHRPGSSPATGFPGVLSSSETLPRSAAGPARLDPGTGAALSPNSHLLTNR